MNLTESLMKIVTDLKMLSDDLEKVVLAAANKNNDDFEEIPYVEESAPAVTLEEVRAVLAEKSRMGMTSAVRNLLNEYGAEKLSTLDPKYYTEILKRAEDLNNGI